MVAKRTTRTSSTTLTPPTDQQRAEVYRHYGLTCPPRYATLRNFDRKTYGGKVAKLAAALGTPLMPWQRYVADTALEIEPATGLVAYRKIGCTVPRQSGKTSLILPVAVHRGMAWQRQRIVYAAQSGTAAREKWEDEHVDALESSVLKPRLRVRKANGREAIIWRKSRSIHGITTNTAKAGHGKTLDLGLADEYFAQVDHRLDAAWSPAMITRENAQRWWFSTAGTSASIPLNEERERGRLLVAGDEPTRTAYFEWSAADGADYRLPPTWRSCMPALCPTPGPCRCSPHWRHTVTEDSVRAELESLDLAEFLRAYMNWTREDDEVEADPLVPTVEAWNLLADNKSRITGGKVFAVDITPKRDHAAIGVAGGRTDGLRHVELSKHDRIDQRRRSRDDLDTDWLMPTIVRMHAEHDPIAWVVDEKGPSATLLEPMRKAGITRIDREKPHRGGVWVPTVAELGAACGSLMDAVRLGTLVHPDEPRLIEAIAGARTRPLGDGAFAWGRKVGTSDISPLVAITLALAGFERWQLDYDVADSFGLERG